ncbi:MAG: NAD kinase [Nitrospinaceae bacterium]|nr:MAG: NAD kinase [Nitrospinaceae bacterium]
MKNIGIFCKPKIPVGQEVLTELTHWLNKKDRQVIMDADTASIVGQDSSYQRSEIPAHADLIIVLGGDGTLLSVARIAHPFNVPILAVNLGSLGFLTEVTLPDLYEVLEKVLNGQFDFEPRMLLYACLWRNGQKVEEYHVLNDVVINKGVLARIVNLEVRVNNQYMTSYRADGLIIATPTGSTAYSLSAGGPIMHPSMNALVLSPICPFTLTNRSIVIPDQSHIQVALATENENVRVTLDGQEGCDMVQGDVLEVKKTQTTIKLIQAPGKNYYQILRKKLHWGSNADNIKS